jgi:undecaprenyl-diphosphatase
MTTPGEREDQPAAPGTAPERPWDRPARAGGWRGYTGRRFDREARFGLRLTIGALAVIAGAFLFVLILQQIPLGSSTTGFDDDAIRYFVGIRNGVLDGLMRTITLLGSPLLVRLAAVVLALVFYLRSRSLRWPILLLVSAIGATLLDELLKYLIGRARPNFHPLAHAPGSAFPSGHATAATAFLGALAYILTRGRQTRTAVLVWTGAAILVTAVAISRVYIGVHWPTDVVGGVIVGASWVVATVTATSVITYRPPEEAVSPAEPDASQHAGLGA